MRPMTSLGAAVAAVLACYATGATAQSVDGPNVVKFGVTAYTSHSKTSGISGVGVPPGADAQVGNATTAIFTSEWLVRPNVGLEFVIGVPPRLEVKATGSIAFLGNDVLSARFLAPTLLINYHFFSAGDQWRPFVGAGINYTRFTSLRSTLAPDVEMSNSTGLALQAGLDYMLTPRVGVFASVAKAHVSSNVVASGATVLTTSVNFRPIAYTAGMSYRF